MTLTQSCCLRALHTPFSRGVHLPLPHPLNPDCVPSTQMPCVLLIPNLRPHPRASSGALTRVTPSCSRDTFSCLPITLTVLPGSLAASSECWGPLGSVPTPPLLVPTA